MDFDKEADKKRYLRIGRKLHRRWEKLPDEEKIAHIAKCIAAWTPEKRRAQIKFGHFKKNRERKKENFNVCFRCGKPFDYWHARLIFEGNPFHRCCLRWHKRDISPNRKTENDLFRERAEMMMKFGGKMQ